MPTRGSNHGRTGLGGVVAHQPILPALPLNGPAKSAVIHPP
ncbi:hypothetical protein [Sphingomonas sp.]